MDPDLAQELLTKLRNGTVTPEEKQVLEAWLLQYRLDESSGLTDAELETLKDQVWPGVLSKTSKKTIRIWPRLAIAGSVLLILSLLTFLYFRQSVKPDSVAQNITPGSQSATLVLGNGQQIGLNNKPAGQVAVQGGMVVSKTASGQLSYSGSASEIMFNTLTTKRKEQYDLILADGTHVWLNAASSLKFPTAFSGKERKVELSGEGYFEVMEDQKHPFIVVSAGQTVEVLGTKFNINSYGDEHSARTTLLEGKVKVESNGTQVTIKPGQQAELTGEVLDVRDIDPRASIDWVDGEFQFNDQPLEEIMRKIARWYDLEVVYRDVDKSRRFGGSVSRFENIAAVLEKLELTGSVTFKIEGRRVTVSR
ncbi:FecR family protein [Pararcticibacter amylolyticus]|uniref:Anti-sigma factor n=1 Tax=Pararcticibacter amylolyticus TaxID=2173175 RepID=A0A2U2PCQ4_9SPHI|nr:FecR family protein [Pararcticibacter amylolyticus]PWG79176.1 hypothetical protein DDR33_17955 [Pararcticibacter amylolyticus]